MANDFSLFIIKILSTILLFQDCLAQNVTLNNTEILSYINYQRDNCTGCAIYDKTNESAITKNASYPETTDDNFLSTFDNNLPQYVSHPDGKDTVLSTSDEGLHQHGSYSGEKEDSSLLTSGKGLSRFVENVSRPGTKSEDLKQHVTHPSGTEDRFMSTSDEGLGDIVSTVRSRWATKPPRRGRGFIIDKGLISKSTYRIVNFVTGCIMLVLPIIGMILNSLNIVIFSSSYMKCPSSTILVCLSTAELFVVIIQMIARTVDFVFGVESAYSYIYLNVTKYLAIYASAVFGRTTYYLFFFVAAERLLAVACPMKAVHFKLIRKPLVACNLIFVVCALYHLYMPSKNTIVSYTLAVNETRYKLIDSAFYGDHRVLITTLQVMGEVIFVYIPLLSCLVLNVFMIAIIRRHGRLRKEILSTTQTLATVSHAEIQMTITILVSSFIFILLVLPIPLGGLVSSIRDDYGIYTKQHYLFLTVSKFGAVSNLLANCSNFIVYYILGGKFRNTLHYKICRKVTKR